jgi:transposase
MPTTLRHPGAQQQRDRLQGRRLRAAELFAVGIRQAQVARQLGVSRQSASDWHARWQVGGADALLSRGPTGPAPRLSDRQLGQVEQALLEGATANGFVSELWTLDRITSVIQRLTGGASPPRARVGAAAPPARLERAAAGASCGRARPGRDRLVGRPGLAADQAKRRSAQRLSGLLRRRRAQPDAKCPLDLGAMWPPTHVGPPVQLDEGVDGCRVDARIDVKRLG